MVSTDSRINLPATLFGGQAFRWKSDGGDGATGFLGELVGDRFVHVRSDGERLAVAPLDARTEPLGALADRYFDAGRAYARIERRIFRDARLRRLSGSLSGIRILRQPVFETLIAFIISANNNIPRIKRSVEALARLAGAPVRGQGAPVRGQGVCAFPTPEALADVDLATLRADANLGYRDRYVADTARLIASGDVDLAAMDRLGTDDVRAALQRLPGVGPKVADCVALFAFARLEVFPVDTWIRQGYAKLYLPDVQLPTNGRIAELARARFGPAAGLAQQYLFEGMRKQ